MKLSFEGGIGGGWKEEAEDIYSSIKPSGKPTKIKARRRTEQALGEGIVLVGLYAHTKMQIQVKQRAAMALFTPPMALRQRCGSLIRYISSSSRTATKVPLLYNKPDDTTDDAVTIQLLSWGQGASGQLGGGKEEIRLYPTVAASLLLPPSSFRLSPTPGRLLPPLLNGEKAVEVGISCGLFHSGLLVDGKLWIWGKGDGGRLGLGHENPAFVPTLNPNLDCVQSIALGGLHSVALDSLGQVFTCLQGLWWFWCSWTFCLS
ncbi:hypothetical protein L1049_024303 [Liquidambar formosana]|uniref:Uncharacterized protein n=1 Tax=Liquidambar formosana TaxID=63359 RepID=A0AAP0RVL4_LIQFO